MRKILLLVFCLVTVIKTVQAQGDDNDLRIQAMKQQLPFLKDSIKAVYLNRIAAAYVHVAIPILDSGYKHALLSYKFSQKTNNKEQLCRAAGLLGKVCLQLSKVNEGLQYYREMIRLAQETHNNAALATAIRGTGQALWYRADFDMAIFYIKTSITYFEKQNARYDIADATLIISNVYGDQGNYEKAFEWARKALEYSTAVHEDAITILALAEFGNLYKTIGDYPTALEYYRKSYAMNPHVGHWQYRYLGACMGDYYLAQQNYDSAHYYYMQTFSGFSRGKTARLKMGNYHLSQQNYDSALYYYSGLYHELSGGAESFIYINSMLGMGKVYLQTKKYALAMRYGTEALKQISSKNSRLNMRDANHLLYRVSEALQRPAAAFAYYKQYVLLKDSIVNDQLKGKLYEFSRIAAEEKEKSQVELLKKEQWITQQKLKGNQMLRNILAGGILFIALLSFIIFWNISLKRKNEKLKSDKIHTALEHKATELEMQALRAQMNPHFIFNCLSSINRFILKNESEKASDYLTRFSRLIRLVLINSQKSLIVLEDEVEMLRLYIEMEQLRFKDAFDYSITYNNSIEPANILIPPLLLQPFCENAIWHGLMHKEGYGQLNISFTMQQETLQCVITDNGIGRAKASEIKSRSAEKMKSFGLKLTTERLALFNENRAVETFYEIEDITDDEGNIAGTRVTLEIRYKESIEESIEV